MFPRLWIDRSSRVAGATQAGEMSSTAVFAIYRHTMLNEDFLIVDADTTSTHMPTSG
jgi:hypothetical protein